MKNGLNSTDSVLIKLQPANHQTNKLKTSFKTENLLSGKVNFSIDFKKLLSSLEKFESDCNSFCLKKLDQNCLSTSSFSSTIYNDVEMKFINKSLFYDNSLHTLSSNPKQSYNDEKLKSSKRFVKKVLNEKPSLRNRESSNDNLSTEFHKIKHVRRSSLKINNNHHRIELKFSSDSTKYCSPSYK